MERREPFYTIGGNISWCGHWWRFLKKLKIELPYDPEIPFLGFYLEKIRSKGIHVPQCSLKIPGVTGKFGLGVQNEAGQRLTEFCQENTLVIANTLFQWHKRWLYIWTSPNGQYWNQINCILCSQRWRSSTQSAKTKLGADCGSDYELLIDKFRLKLKKVGKTTRPFRYDLNQIPYNYTAEVRHRFKGLDLMDGVLDELQMEVHDTV